MKRVSFCVSASVAKVDSDTMKTLEGPVKKYTSGAFPSHSAHGDLAKNFKGLAPEALRFVLQKEGLVGDSGKPTKRAAELGLVDRCDNVALWNMKELEEKLFSLGNRFERQAVNQEVDEPTGTEPQWANLGTIGTYFSVSATIIGRWLDELGMRNEEGMASDDSLERGLATTFEMSTGEGKNKTRKITHWNLHLVRKLLMENGHPLNFDYGKSLKGSGRNSDVKVETVDDRAKAFAKEFVRIFKDRGARKELPALVKKTPKIIQQKAEALIDKPGFITTGAYLRHISEG